MTKPNLNASSRIMWEEAQQRGIECVAFGDHETILMRFQDKHWYTRGSRTSLQSSVGKSIADKKNLTKSVLEYYKLPTSQFLVINSIDEIALLSKLTFPLVMKPLAERHGKGVIVGIANLEAARQALQQAAQPMLFEETLIGVEYRIVCIDFKFLAAAFRKPAHVTGDGVHSIEELIAEKNQHPWRGEGHTNFLSLIKVDNLVLSLLAEQQLDLAAIPPQNQEVLLRKTANLSTGGEAWDVTDQVCEQNRTLFGQIAQACDLNTVGIDIMCRSLAEPIINQPQAGVIEVNASPGLRMHHYPIKGKSVNVAGAIIDMVLQKI